MRDDPLISCQDCSLSPSDFLEVRSLIIHAVACFISTLHPHAWAKGHLFTALKEYFLTAGGNDGIPIADDIFLQAIHQTCLWGDYRCRDTVGRVDRGPEAGSERILRG
jgi:hypothetical protein